MKYSFKFESQSMTLLLPETIIALSLLYFSAIRNI